MYHLFWQFYEMCPFLSFKGILCHELLQPQVVVCVYETHVVISGRPAGVELRVQLPFFPGQLVVLGLFLSRQRMPLRTQTTKSSKGPNKYVYCTQKSCVHQQKQFLHLHLYHVTTQWNLQIGFTRPVNTRFSKTPINKIAVLNLLVCVI